MAREVKKRSGLSGSLDWNTRFVYFSNFSKHLYECISSFFLSVD